MIEYIERKHIISLSGKNNDKPHKYNQFHFPNYINQVWKNLENVSKTILNIYIYIIYIHFHKCINVHI